MLTILFYNVSFSLIIDLYFVTEVFVVTTEFEIPTGIPIKDARAEIETHPISVKARISECSI